MANGVNINIDNLDNVQRLIELRNKALGQTTKQSASALAVNIITSLRSNTRLANEKKLNFEISDVTANFKPSWSRKSGFCFRNANGSKLAAPSDWMIVRTKEGHKRSFHVIDKDVGKEYIVVCDTKEQAKQAVKEKHIKRIKHYKGLAKAALGIAQAKIAEKSGYSKIENENVRKSALGNVEVSVEETGFDSGEVKIHMLDSLNYAADALRSGHGYVQVASQKALNKMVG